MLSVAARQPVVGFREKRLGLPQQHLSSHPRSPPALPTYSRERSAKYPWCCSAAEDSRVRPLLHLPSHPCTPAWALNHHLIIWKGNLHADFHCFTEHGFDRIGMFFLLICLRRTRRVLSLDNLNKLLVAQRYHLSKTGWSLCFPDRVEKAAHRLRGQAMSQQLLVVKSEELINKSMQKYKTQSSNSPVMYPQPGDTWLILLPPL